MICKRLTEVAMVTLSFFVIGCGVSEQNATKTASIGFITTPPSYYSSAKARYLGTKYKENLDRLAERIVRNPKTSRLQFANNIASVGGIGFFTHAATNTADERFLEVIVSAPDTFESQGDLNGKVLRVFFAYGAELLSILAADSDIYQEKEVSGYGLNLTWRSLVPDAKGTRVVLERAVIYVTKDKVRGFLHQEVDQNKFLADAIIFTAADNGPMNLVSYRQQDPRLDTRLPIQEESLAVPQIETRVESRPAPELGRETARETLSPSPPAGDARSMPAREKTGSGSEMAKAAAANANQSQGGIVGSIASGTSKSADDKRTALLPRSTGGAHVSTVTETQPIAEKKVAPLISEQSPVGGKSSLAGGLESPRPTRSVLPAQRNQVAATKATPDPLANGMAHGDPQGGATADARSVSPDASKNAPVKNRDTAVAAKAEVKAPPVPAVATIPLPERSSSSTSDKGTNERIALQKNRASEIMPKAQAGVAAQSKALEGYIIQLGFKDKGDAQRWAEMMERRGYAVSVTEAGGMESVRVRVGNFLVREEADRQLISLKQEGLTGIVINLPQAYRPDMRAPSSERSETQFVQPQGAQELGGKR